MGRVALGLILVLSASADEGAGWDLQRVVFGESFAEAADPSVEVRVARADAKGGEVTFTAACAEGGSHTRSYRCAWDFHQDLSHVAAGQAIRASVRIVDDARGACTLVPAAAPTVAFLVGGPQTVLRMAREDHDLDTGAFQAEGTRSLSARERGAAEGTLEAVASRRGGAAGRRGVLDLVFWTGRNRTLHVVYLFAPSGGKAAPSIEQVDLVLAAAVGEGTFDSSLDADGDGRATSWDAMVLWQHQITAGVRVGEADGLTSRPREVAVPSVEGTSAAEAKGALLAAGLEVRFDGLGPDEGEFFVERLDPAPRSRVERGTMIAVTLARRASSPGPVEQPRNPPGRPEEPRILPPPPLMEPPPAEPPPVEEPPAESPPAAPPPEAPPPAGPPPAEEPPQPENPLPEVGPFLGTWRGTWVVEDGGKDAWLGPVHTKLEVQLVISVEEGTLVVERAGSDVETTARLEGGALVAEWPIEGGTASMRLQTEKRELRGSVSGVNADGSANGIARVRMKQGK